MSWPEIEVFVACLVLVGAAAGCMTGGIVWADRLACSGRSLWLSMGAWFGSWLVAAGLVAAAMWISLLV